MQNIEVGKMPGQDMSWGGHMQEWWQSLLYAAIFAIGSLLLFALGGVNFNTSNGRLLLFAWLFMIGMLAVYLALNVWTKDTWL
jgi:hypothetical protein